MRKPSSIDPSSPKSTPRRRGSGYAPINLVEIGVELIINYNRRSRQDIVHEKQTGEDTLKTQREIMDRTLLPLNIPYVQLDEIGSGDKISTRPVFQGVLEDLQTGKYQAIAVKEISRMGRGSYSDMGIIYDLLESKRIIIITPYRIYDPRNPSDAKQIRFELFMSREEFETTKERLAGGRFTNALLGCWMSGKPPYGFSVNKKTRKLVPMEMENARMNLIYDLWNDGILLENGELRDCGTRALATYLSSIGVRSPKGKHWRPDNLEYFLKNPVNVGTVVQFTTETLPDGSVIPRPEEEHVIVENAHPGQISKEKYDRAQEKFTRLEQERLPHTRADAQTYILTGLCRCKKCGRRLIVQTGNPVYEKNDGSLSIYKRRVILWCTTTGCTFVKYDVVVDNVVESLKYLRDLDNELMEQSISSLIDQQANHSKNSEQILQQIDNQILELDRRINFIYERYELGKYSDDVFEKRLAEAEAERGKLIESKSSHRKEDPQKPNVNTVKRNINSILEAYHACGDDAAAKNVLLRQVFEDIEILLLEKGHGNKYKKTPAKIALYPKLKSSILIPFS
jgi:site-specific DNA recombinase